MSISHLSVPTTGADGSSTSGSTAGSVTGPMTVANEFAEVTIRRVNTHNGVRLEVSSPRLGRAVRLDALQLEALTWQTPDAFSSLLADPFGPSPDLGPPDRRP